jgi:hypothetical protein
MFLARLRVSRYALVLTSAPTTARPSEESEALIEKYNAQVMWMKERGIPGSSSFNEIKNEAIDKQ